MKIGIAIEDEFQKQEISEKHISEGVKIVWAGSTEELMQVADAAYWVDCTFSGRELPYFEKPTLVHAPELVFTKNTSAKQVARFCAWPTFLSRSVWEVAANTGKDTEWVTTLGTALGRRIVSVQDAPGLVSPRVVSTIINEAYFALQAGISTAEEIDIAMKLGTNYPFGPLEWCQRIGSGRVHRLLRVLSQQDKLYEPAFLVSE